MKTAAAYIRVSTDEQTEYSPDAQLKTIKEFCRKNEYLLFDEHVYADEGISGRSAAKRPAFQRMIGAAKSKEKPFEVIVVHRFDRFARSREDSVVYKSLLRRECGVRVVSVTENIEDDKFSVILEAMLEAMAEYYSINLSEEVKKGMTEKATRGEPLTIAPFGYVMNEKRLIPHPEQARIVQDIFARFVEGKTILKISKELNRADVHSNRGNFIENRTIEYILRNPVYIGKIRWNPVTKTRRKYDHPDLIIADGEHEPLIDNETWKKAQAKIMENKKLWSKSPKAQSRAGHWLVGLVRCEHCGAGLLRNGPDYLQCGAYAKGKCAVSHALNITVAENVILAQINEDTAKTAALNIISDNAQSNNGYFDKQLAALERRLLRERGLLLRCGHFRRIQGQ